MSFATLDDLRSQLGRTPTPADDPAYVAKQLHKVPKATTVDRTVFILQRVAGKRVLEFGASGPMHDGIVKAAASVVGVDKMAAPGVVVRDLDEIEDTPESFAGRHWLRHLYFEDEHGATIRPDVIVCGEILEHLSNPGWFLTRLRREYPGVPVVVSVPNAFSAGGQAWLKKGIENVNRDHVAWYSPKTLAVLLGRCGYAINEFHWYGGDGPTAEGLIVVAE